MTGGIGSRGGRLRCPSGHGCGGRRRGSREGAAMVAARARRRHQPVGARAAPPSPSLPPSPSPPRRRSPSLLMGSSLASPSTTAATRTPLGCLASSATARRGPLRPHRDAVTGQWVEEVLPAARDRGWPLPLLQLRRWPPDYGHGLR
jgi:hypothetical protein